MNEHEMNALKIKLIKFICELEDESVLQKLIDLMDKYESEGRI